MDEWAFVFLRPQVNKYSHKGIRMVTLPGYICQEEHETFEDAGYGRLSNAHKNVTSGTLNLQFCHN